MHQSADFAVSRMGSVSFLNALSSKAKNVFVLRGVHPAVKVGSGILVDTSYLDLLLEDASHQGMKVQSG